ncbi:hypothetical protein [Williamwhitmania taraxaci]|uniref:Uncharacterized protein n=1 Tax=Williamwhitmania taraxaci TaxID=1640674 RepID=A0A1G6NU99_9BACT|nr:hypothetical protein [Williamwhitmania taraxaci]SDC71590.1 hypothetical protein SAMN05216323_10462 [Williamwhitmania taraxaci]
MKQNIYYIVESSFYRKDIGNKLDFLFNNGDLKDAIHFSCKQFSDESPIIARENAFRHFQSIVDVLYDGLNKKYTTDKQARIDLQKYFNSGNDFEFLSNSPNQFKISDDFFNGINIYMIVDKAITDTNNKNDKVRLHGINYVDYHDRIEENIVESFLGLIKEFHYYDQYSYSFKDYLTFIDFDKIGGDIESVLKTPFDLKSFIINHKGENLL